MNNNSPKDYMVDEICLRGNCNALNFLEDEHYFARWNQDQRQQTRNCYTFAGDCFKPDILQIFAAISERSEDKRNIVRFRLYTPEPGVTGGKRFDSMTTEGLGEAIARDGFIPLPQKEQSEIIIPPNHYLIAAYCYQNDLGGGDYHFYRYSQHEKIWYHKGGWNNPVSCLDCSQKIILDPQRADREKFTDFVGFFLSPPNRPPLDIIVKDSHGLSVYRKGSFHRQTPSLPNGFSAPKTSPKPHGLFPT